jgi:hypothetical protein
VERLTLSTIISPPPPKAAPPSYAAAVIMFGESLFGAEWQGQMSRLTGVSRRTLVRLVGAQRAGKDHPAAPRILAALNDQLSPLATLARDWAHHANPKG